VGVVSYIDFEEENLADALQPADNIVDLEFNWLDDNILVSDLLPVFRRWSNLRRLTLQADWLPYYDLDVPSLISLLDFTVSMKSLIYFRIRDDIHLQE
jgi:hypothetical protein